MFDDFQELAAFSLARNSGKGGSMMSMMSTMLQGSKDGNAAIIDQGVPPEDADLDCVALCLE